MALPIKPPPLSLYVHMPWCVRKCPYCDFNSYRAPQTIPARQYCDALLADLEQDARWVEGRTIGTVFFGGGTPSLFPAHEIARFLDQAAGLVAFAEELEITLEANPGTVEHQDFLAYAGAGINRVSLGVQSFDDATLRRLGRIHTSAAARRAIDEIAAAGFASFNVDLMYGLPGQDEALAGRDLEHALTFSPPHLSYYQLTLEPGTFFAARPPADMPSEELLERIEGHGRELLRAAEYQRYETSAWARPGQQCRHNRNYWQFGDYLGIGAGAHGKISAADGALIWRSCKQRHPTRYSRLAATAQRLERYSSVPACDLGFEFMLNALRLHQPVAEPLLSASTGLRFSDLRAPINDAVDRGLLHSDDNCLRVTRLGRRFLNDLQACFLSARVCKTSCNHE